ncbi:MAG TPA: PxKF domain-containing protein [Nitriliruptorales bacterium]|nr:PxKF domain-containing protein [Nitriliruptorales bacterium]
MTRRGTRCAEEVERRMKVFSLRALRVVTALSVATAFAWVLAVSEASATGLPQIDAGAYHTCAVQTDGSLACWGNNDYGQSSPPAGTFASVSSGFWHSCGVRTDGSLACWGWNGYGQTSPPAGSFKSVTTGYAHTCAVRADDAAVCWGGYGYGTSPPSGSFSDVASGNDFSCGVRTTGALTCWGYNHPDGNAAIPPSGTFTSVEIGMWHSCAVRTDDSAACWGQNGHGESNPPTGSFASVSTGGAHSCGITTGASLACWGASLGTQPAGSFDSVSSGYVHACAVKIDGTIVCWGSNSNGQTDVPVTDSTAPTVASSITGTLGQNGWYTSDVTLAWSVSEPESPDSLSKTGCVGTSITADQQATTYSCSASSLGGSAGPVAVTIKRDATAPTVACGSPAPAFSLGEGGASVSASVSDATSGPVSASVSTAADTATVGPKSVSLTGSDNAGNTTTEACAYRVGYVFSGFAQPVDNTMINAAKAGRAIPLKFRVTVASGNPVTDLSAAPITTVSLDCGTLTEGVDAIEEYAAGASGLQNLGDGNYQINWKSPTTYTGTCKRLRLDLGEGTYRTADFRFVK